MSGRCNSIFISPSSYPLLIIHVHMYTIAIHAHANVVVQLQFHQMFISCYWTYLVEIPSIVLVISNSESNNNSVDTYMKVRRREMESAPLSGMWFIDDTTWRGIAHAGVPYAWYWIMQMIGMRRHMYACMQWMGERMNGEEGSGKQATDDSIRW